MSNNDKGYRIKVIKDGPYIVKGNVALSEKIIEPNGRGYELKEGCELPQAEEYHLCRCGKSKNPPFCDGSHIESGFVGTESDLDVKYEDRAELIEGPGIDLMDDNWCAFGRFCHREKGNVWELTKNSNSEEIIKEAIKAASDCPSGRLTAIDKTGKAIEPQYEPSIEIIQDPQRGVSAGIFVKGNIPIESADSCIYEIRNRVALCRCGKSRNKPFCDGSHVSTGFTDKQ